MGRQAGNAAQLGECLFNVHEAWFIPKEYITEDSGQHSEVVKHKDHELKVMRMLQKSKAKPEPVPITGKGKEVEKCGKEGNN